MPVTAIIAVFVGHRSGSCGHRCTVLHGSHHCDTLGGWSREGNIVPMPLIGLFSIGILIGCYQHLADCLWWLSIKLFTELVVVVESSAERRDDLRFTDVGNLVPYF
jgi:hypothetical protein